MQKKVDEFIIIGRTEALIADLGVEEALERAMLMRKLVLILFLSIHGKKILMKYSNFIKRWKGKIPIMICSNCISYSNFG